MIDYLFPIAFIIISLSLLGGALWLMWSAGSSIDNEPIKNYRQGTWTTQVTRGVHPEMRDVEPGTELMGVNFEEKPTSCDLEEYRALQDRIEELRLELDPDDEDDDDDDGDVPAIVRT